MLPLNQNMYLSKTYVHNEIQVFVSSQKLEYILENYMAATVIRNFKVNFVFGCEGNVRKMVNIITLPFDVQFLALQTDSQNKWHF